MSTSSLKRINKEIKNFNEKTYSTNIFSHKLLEFLGNLSLIIIISNSTSTSTSNSNSNTNKDEYFLLIKNSKNKKLLELKFPEYYPFKPYSVISYDSNVKNNFLCNEFSYYKYLINVANKIQTKDKNIYKFFFKNLYSLQPTFLDLSKNDCYCCNSITCRNMWSPASTINSIIYEYLEIRFIETYSSEKEYSYLCNIYNNLIHNILGKLPPEIIETILG
jgi:hypothetical protein